MNALSPVIEPVRPVIEPVEIPVSTSSTTGHPTTGHPTTGHPTTGHFCGHCGEASDGGGLPTSDSHQSCHEHLAMEPPRYCALCRRRMKVQVTPLGWTAQCSRHGALVQ